MHRINYIIPALLFLIVLFLPRDLSHVEFKEFRVVVNPGHGGIALIPQEVHGDRFDLISGKYLDKYREGASYRDYVEHEIVYSIAEKTMAILKHCSKDGDFKKFYSILVRYTVESPVRIVINSTLSRGDSRDVEEVKSREDPNSGFRLFDYPASDDEMAPGRISRINALKPQLVVSLHLAEKAPSEYRGLNPVIVAPYSILYSGLEYLRGKNKKKEFFTKSPYIDWFAEASNRSDFYWFLKDVIGYFMGYIRGDDGEVDLNNFRGYRFNMVTWSYSDDPGWEDEAREHEKGTHYSSSVDSFVPEGRFWDRERSIYEKYRRDGGEEGYGGDNLYASAEIARYVLLSVKMRTDKNRQQDLKLTRPYISVWTMPLHINAISAFLELGYLRIKNHRYMFDHKQNEIAEGVAVGIYSLLTGIKLKNFDIKQRPKGKPVDLDKYRMSEQKYYFDQVVSE